MCVDYITHLSCCYRLTSLDVVTMMVQNEDAC
jgi:hypothetical protein